MLEQTHIPEARWWIVKAVHKKAARLNCISHLLTQICYEEVAHPPVHLPERIRQSNDVRRPIPAELFVPGRF